MGEARVNGSNAQLIIASQSLLLPIPLGEIDSFEAESQTSIIKTRPVGFTNERATLNYGGWDLSFSGGKVDWARAHFYWLQDMRIRNGKLPPSLCIWQTIEHYNGSQEQYIYKNVVLFGLKFTASGVEEVQESMSGFASARSIGYLDNTILSDVLGYAAREGLFRAKIGISDDITNAERPF
jgi:hypothetical protein